MRGADEAELTVLERPLSFFEYARGFIDPYSYLPVGARASVDNWYVVGSDPVQLAAVSFRQNNFSCKNLVYVGLLTGKATGAFGGGVSPNPRWPFFASR